MFKITKRVRRFAIEKLGLSANATDFQITDACAKAVADGVITKSALKQMGEPPPQKVNLGDVVKREVAKALKSAQNGDKGGGTTTVTKKTTKGKKTTTKSGKTHKPESKLDKLIEKRVNAQLARLGMGPDEPSGTGGTPHQLLARASSYMKPDGTANVRVKSAIEQYDSTRKDATYPERTHLGMKHLLAGRPAFHEGRMLHHPSELDKALCGAYFKWALNLSSSPHDIPRALRMTDHDRDLVQYALRSVPWTGIIKGDGTEVPGAIRVDRRKLSEYEVKALLDDSTSGGLEAAPIVFDDAVILTPVLFGELFPWVNVVPITRGRRIEGFSLGNPTFTSGTAEGTAITPFDTASFIAAFDTTIYNAVAAMEIGLDFEEDAPNDIGGIVVERYGLKSMEWLDRVIAVGDGTTEPTGIFTSSGTTAVSSDNSTNGPPTVSDYEGLMFGLTKAFRMEPGAQSVFLSNETTYRRARGIPVGPTDERRVFGMDHGSYMMLEHPHKIQVDIPNNKVAFVNLKRYRMYRRLGLNIRIETAGNYLALRNLKLIVLRMRWGGQIELGGAAAVCTDAQN